MWGAQYRGVAGLFRFAAYQARKPHLLPFMLGAGVSLALVAVMPVSNEAFKSSITWNRDAIMAQKLKEHKEKHAGGHH